MAVQDVIPYSEALGNGVSKQFPLGFPCDKKESLKVKINEIEVSTEHWFLNQNTVIFNTAPETNVLIQFERSTKAIRTTDYATYNDSLRGDVLNSDFDRIWWKLQELGLSDWLLRQYVDRKDDELKAFLLEEIQKQGVALDQLDDYYNYLMQRLAQIAVDKGWDASFVVDASGKTQQFINDELIAITRYGSVNKTGSADASAGIQAIVSAIEASENKTPYYYFPTDGSVTYRLDSPVFFRKGALHVFGFHAPSYTNHDRKGWFEVNNTQAGFDIGASENVNPGDGWSFSGLGFKQSAGIAANSADGIRLTSARNAPDRGYTFERITCLFFNRGMYVANNANYVAGTMVIEKSNLSKNNYGLYCDQKVEGLRFVGNQCEQNKIGGLKIKGAGGITITDNMLEGQPNTIEIDSYSNGQGTQVEIKRNYFEANVGDYLISYKDTSYGKGSLEIANNQIADLGKLVNGTVVDTDFCRIYNNQYGYGYTIINREAYPITFMDDATILPDSNLIGKLNSFFIQKSFNGNLGSKIYSNDILRFANDPTYKQLDVASGRTVETPFGFCIAPSADDTFFSVAQYNAGDVVSVNILLKFEFSDSLQSGLYFHVLDSAKTSTIVNMVSSAITQAINKQYILGTFTFKVPSNQSSLFFKVRSSNEPTAITMLTGCVKNFGQFVAPVKISPVLPKFNKKSFSSFDVTGIEVAANSQTSNTYTLTGARLGDFVNTTYSLNVGGIIINAWVSASNIVTVSFRNNTSAPITLPTGKLKIKTSST